MPNQELQKINNYIGIFFSTRTKIKQAFPSSYHFKHVFFPLPQSYDLNVNITFFAF